MQNIEYRKYRKYAVSIVVVICVTIIYLLKHHFDKKNIPRGINVAVATVQTKNVPVYINALGTVTPENTVNIKTKVNGQLLNVLFTDGQFVKKGDILVEIDSRPYKAQLVQNEGQLERDMALLENSILDLNRYEILWKDNSISRQILDTQRALVKQYEGNVKTDKGLIESTKLYIDYCTITSPIDGIIGIGLVSVGNFLQTNDANPIAVINSIDPIYVIFSITENDLPHVMQQFKKQGFLIVEVYDHQQKVLISTGKLIAIDNQIDSTTGMVKLEAEFANKDYNLFPNQFVNIKLLVDNLENVTVVPTNAVQHGPSGDFVYLVQDKINKVAIKMVKVGITNLDDTVISSGVLDGQQVVVNGADKLTDGADIIISFPVNDVMNK